MIKNFKTLSTKLSSLGGWTSGFSVSPQKTERTPAQEIRTKAVHPSSKAQKPKSYNLHHRMIFSRTSYPMDNFSLLHLHLYRMKSHCRTKVTHQTPVLHVPTDLTSLIS